MRGLQVGRGANENAGKEEEYGGLDILQPIKLMLGMLIA